jgi:hypothetical protein
VLFNTCKVQKGDFLLTDWNPTIYGLSFDARSLEYEA